MANSKILTAEQERALRQPIDEYVGGIQKEIDALRKDGTTKVVECQSAIAGIKRDKTLSKGEKESEIAACEKELAKAKAVEAKNKDEISKLIAKAEIEADEAKRTAYITEALKLEKENYYHIPLHEQSLPWAMRKNIDAQVTPIY